MQRKDGAFGSSVFVRRHCRECHGTVGTQARLLSSWAKMAAAKRRRGAQSATAAPAEPPEQPDADVEEGPTAAEPSRDDVGPSRDEAASACSAPAAAEPSSPMGTGREGSEEDSAEEGYEVERIVGKRKRGSNVEYRVRWKGYDASDDTWEPLFHLANATAKVKAFEQAQARSRGSGRGGGGRGRGRGHGHRGRKAKPAVPVATVVVTDSNGSSTATETSSVDSPGATSARWALLQASRSVTEAWRVATMQSTDGSPVDPPAHRDSPGVGGPRNFTCKHCGSPKKAPNSKCPCQIASQSGDDMPDPPVQSVNTQDREPGLQVAGAQIDGKEDKTDTAPVRDEPDKIKAGFAELTYHSSSAHQANKDKFTIRVAVTEDGTTYVSIADFLEFIRVHNRLNAQSMASNLITDAKKKREYELVHGAINRSKRRTPMIRMADQLPKYVRSIGKLKALKLALPDRDAAALWDNFCSSGLREWFDKELETSTRVDGVLAQWTDEQWAHHTQQVTNGAAAVGRCQSTRKRKMSTQEGARGTKWVYRELSTVLVTLPVGMNAGDAFSLRVPGVDVLVHVEFPEGGLPGKPTELKLVDPILQKVLASEMEPGARCIPCYDERDEDQILKNLPARERPTNRVPSLLEIAAMRAEMQSQPGLQHVDVSVGKESVPIPVVNTVDDEVFDLDTFRYVPTPEYPEKIQALIDAAPPVPCNCTDTCGGVGAALCSCVDRYGDVYDLVVRLELKALPPNQRPAIASAVSDCKEGAASAGRRRPGVGVPRFVRARKVGEAEWKIYPSINQAHKGTGVGYNEVHKCCRTALGESGGYAFEYCSSLDPTGEETSPSGVQQDGNLSPKTAAAPLPATGKKSRPCSCKTCGAQKMSPNEKCRSCNPGSSTARTPASATCAPATPAEASSAPERFECGAMLAKAVADALGGLDVSSIHSDEDNHKTGGGLDGVASMQYKTQVDNETMSSVAALFGTSVVDVLDSSKHWYPDLSASSKMFPGTYVRLPAQIGRLAVGCYGLMNIAGTSLGPQEVKSRLSTLQAAGASWEATEVKATRYGAYHKGRLGPAISFSVIHECTDACGCVKLHRRLGGTTEGCGNRHLQRGIRPDVLLEVFRAGTEKGWGLRSRTFIPAGTFVCEYVGEIMTDTEANERGRLKGPEYLFDLDVAVQRRQDEERQKTNGKQQKDDGEQEDNSVEGDEGAQEFVRLCQSGCNRRLDDCSASVVTRAACLLGARAATHVPCCGAQVIDAKHVGGVARFINHCCDPNLVVQNVLAGHSDERLTRVGFVRFRRICAHLHGLFD